MWWRTAWPSTRSNVASSNGSRSASVTTVSTSRPRSAAFVSRARSIPGAMSVAVALLIVPAFMRLSEK